jgi:hypothetical protein
VFTSISISVASMPTTAAEKMRVIIGWGMSKEKTEGIAD